VVFLWSSVFRFKYGEVKVYFGLGALREYITSRIQSYNLKASLFMVGMSVYKVFSLINWLMMNSTVINVVDGGISDHPNCPANDRCKPK
jgi:hypothetical protein